MSAACDQGARDDAPAHGPALHIVAAYPSPGQGTNAASDASVDCNEPTPECPVPTDMALELRFDRFLLPNGIWAGLRMYSGDKANAVGLTAEYDLVERVVVYRTDRTLEPYTLYTVEVVPSTNPALGLWAFDRAPIEEGAVPLQFSFSTGSGPGKAAAAPPQAAESCDAMLGGPLASCANCHTTQPGPETVPPTKYPPMGLDLSTPRGLFYTAIQHVAHQAETGDTAANVGLEAPLRFGEQMNVVDPGSPATSYLMYKLLEKPENFTLDGSEPTCLTGYHAPVADDGCQPPSADELVQLREWFVRGDPMPKDPSPIPGQPAFGAAISHANLVRIAGWIASGATCVDGQ